MMMGSEAKKEKKKKRVKWKGNRKKKGFKKRNKKTPCIYICCALGKARKPWSDYVNKIIACGMQSGDAILGMISFKYVPNDHPNHKRQTLRRWTLISPRVENVLYVWKDNPTWNKGFYSLFFLLWCFHNIWPLGPDWACWADFDP